jgi:tetratricopeptide (TPR) repeat protein
VRGALTARAGAGRSAWLHRQVAWVLARRPGADPGEVADHARRGGDLELAARSLRAAAARAAERFDHATAEALLDDALSLHPDPAGWLDRARVRTRRGQYDAAYRDVERARPLGAGALEVGAWASYFDRRFEQASAFATDGATIAEDAALRARCLTVAGRTRHAAGDLAAAESLLGQAIQAATGADRMIASAWLGVLRSHQSHPQEALALLRPATRPELQAEHTSAVLHALLFTGHAHALAGHPVAALEAFERYTIELERRQVLRFDGRGTNFAGWVLRNLAASSEGVERHLEALEIAGRIGGPELRVAALEDLAEDRLTAGDVEAADRHLAAAGAALHGDLVFGWRLRFKLELLQARSALARDDPQDALRTAGALAVRAGELGVPRYASVARLLVHRARAALGEPVDLGAVAIDLVAVRQAVAIEAWWWTGESAAAHHVPQWVDKSADQVEELAGHAGARGRALRSAAAARLETWRAAADT